MKITIMEIKKIKNRTLNIYVKAQYGNKASTLLHTTLYGDQAETQSCEMADKVHYEVTADEWSTIVTRECTDENGKVSRRNASDWMKTAMTCVSQVF